MILYEYEGKELLSKAGIHVPRSQIVASPDEKITAPFPVVLKAQVLSGKRAQAGGIVVVENASEVGSALKKMFGKLINNEKVGKILVEEKIDIDKEFYVSILYDTDTRS